MLIRKVIYYIEICFRCLTNAVKVNITFKNYFISKVLWFLKQTLGFVLLKYIKNIFEIPVYSVCEML